MWVACTGDCGDEGRRNGDLSPPPDDRSGQMTSGGAKLVIGVVLDLDLQSSVFNGDAVFEAVGDSIVDGVARMAVGHQGKGVLSVGLTSCSEHRCEGGWQIGRD